MATIVLIGTLDTKGEEYSLARRLLEAVGCVVTTIDVGTGAASDGGAADVPAERVAAAAGASLQALRRGGDRGAAMEAMARGAALVARELFEAGRLDGVLAMGGSGGSSIATAAMRALPIGVPKLMVSTIASGDVGPYVGTSDIMMLYPVVDLAGLNAISERIIRQAATAIAAMASLAADAGPIAPERPVVAMTMFGVTTPAATAARAWLESAGYEVLAFHANGAGGDAMEALVRDGLVRGVLDLTTTEFADALVGGNLPAGPERLKTAGALGVPQVVSLGALDMVNFGPMETVPEQFRERLLYRHNPHVTLMRTTSEECAALGRMLADRLNRATGPVAVFAPTGGLSAISKPGGVFSDPKADAALVASLRSDLDPATECVVQETDINDTSFARAMAEKLHEFLEEAAKRETSRHH